MEIARAELVEIKDSLDGMLKVPYTFYSLTPSEKMTYNSFRHDHLKLEKEIPNITRDDREKKEKELSKRFVDFISPLIGRHNLKITGSYIRYGENKDVHIETPAYILFSESHPFNVAIQAKYKFFLKKKDFVSESYLDYTSKEMRMFPGRHLLYDLMEKCLENRKPETIQFRGNFIYFAPANMVMKFMNFTEILLRSIGPEAINELSVLRRECYNKKEGEEIQQKVFMNAYEGMLERELVKAGAIDQNIVRIK